MRFDELSQLQFTALVTFLSRNHGFQRTEMADVIKKLEPIIRIMGAFFETSRQQGWFETLPSYGILIGVAQNCLDNANVGGNAVKMFSQKHGSPPAIVASLYNEESYDELFATIEKTQQRGQKPNPAVYKEAIRKLRENVKAFLVRMVKMASVSCFACNMLCPVLGAESLELDHEDPDLKSNHLSAKCGSVSVRALAWKALLKELPLLNVVCAGCNPKLGQQPKGAKRAGQETAAAATKKYKGSSSSNSLAFEQ